MDAIDINSRVIAVSRFDEMLNRVRVCDITLFLFLSTTFGNQLSGGYDRLLRYASLVLYLATSVLTLARERERRERIFEVSRIAPFVTWIVVFWAYAYLSYFWAADKAYLLSKRVYMTRAVTVLLTCPFIAKQYQTEEELYRLLGIMVAANLYAAMMLILRTPRGDWGNERVGMAIGVDRNIVGMRCAVGSLMCIVLFQKKRKLIYLPALVTLMGIAFMTGSRKVVFIVVAGMVALAIADGLGRDDIIHIMSNIIKLAIILLFAYFVATRIEAIRNVFWSRVETLISYIAGDNSMDSSASMRDWLRDYALKMWKQKPIFGWGLVGFEAEMSHIMFRLVGYSHNNYTELLATLGLVGLFIYYSMYLHLIIMLSKGLHQESSIQRFGLVLLLVLSVAEYGFVSFVYVDAYYYLTLMYCIARYALSPIVEDEMHYNRIDNVPRSTMGYTVYSPKALLVDRELVE